MSSTSNVITFPVAKSARVRTISPPHPLEPWQEAVIQLIAQGCSIAEAMRRVRLPAAAFHTARRRQPAFAERVSAARMLHRAQVEDALHDAEVYARNLLDSLQRNLDAPHGLRSRAARAILNWKARA